MGSMEESLSREDLREVLQVCMLAGQILLETGSNTHRVEESMVRLGRALGADDLEIYVTPTGIVASAIAGREHRTRIHRIGKMGVQLSRYAGVLELVAEAESQGMDRGAALDRLHALEHMPRHHRLPVTALAVGLGCSSLMMLLGGNASELGAVFAVATLAQVTRDALIPIGRFLSTAVVASLATALTLVLAHAFALSPIIVPASLLLLVPGVPLVSGTADLFRGDLAAGMMRGTAAALRIACIGAGVWAVLLFTGQKLDLTVIRLAHPMLVVLAGAGGAFGFAVLFDVPIPFLLWAALNGALGVTVRWLALQHGLPLVASSFLGGVAVGAGAEALAIARKASSTLFAAPGFIPLVPGVLAFRAILHLADERYLEGLSDGLRGILILLALALGMGLAHSLTVLAKPRLSSARA